MIAVHRIFILTIFIILHTLAPATGHAGEANCASCHEKLSAGKSVHTAISMGCASCHTAIDTTNVPHKITNKNPRGLSAKMRDFCYSCHDRKLFMNNTVHGAVLLGCTSCHNPHASDHANLLKEDVPQLCLSCHAERAIAQKGKTHEMAGKEACSSCHNPHATANPKLIQTGRNAAPDNRTALAAKPAPLQNQ